MFSILMHGDKYYGDHVMLDDINLGSFSKRGVFFNSVSEIFLMNLG
jgi:hypothetical protein